MDEAIDLLGVSRERMNELREANEVRGYRDGASWKFRGEDIDRLVQDGVPEPEQSGISDATMQIGSASSSGLGAIDGPGEPLEDLDELRLDEGSDAGVSDEFELDLEGDSASDGVSDSTAIPASRQPEPPSAKSELEIEPLDDDDDADSILLSEAELGDDGGMRPPSTIIGRSEAPEESDLKLASSPSDVASMSDVRLAEPDEIAAPGSVPAPESSKGGFENLEEIDIDLEIESSKILPPEQAAAARKAAREMAQQAPAPPEDSGIELELEDAEGSSAPMADSSADNDFGLGDSGSSVVLSDDEDDDFVLGGGGSQVGISGGDSGINLNPSDSGIALDDVPLEMSGAQAGSSFDLGSSLDIDTGASALGSGAPVQGEDFLLTPLGDAGDDEDSSQVIALEEMTEESPEVSGFGSLSGTGFSSTGLSGAGLSGAGLSGAGLSGTGLSDAGLSGAGLSGVGFSGSGIGGDEQLGGAMPPSSIAMPTVPEAQFDVFSLSLLTVCLIPMTLGAMVMTDLIRTMWSYEEPTVIGSSLIEGLRSLFGGS